MSEKQQWAHSSDEENYGVYSDTREEAIKYGLDLYDGEPFWIGRCVEPRQPEDLWHADDWLEYVSCQDEYSMDCADGWDSGITKSEKDELEAEVRKVMTAWLDRTKNRPDFYLIEDAEQINPEEGDN